MTILSAVQPVIKGEKRRIFLPCDRSLSSLFSARERERERERGASLAMIRSNYSEKDPEKGEVLDIQGNEKRIDNTLAGNAHEKKLMQKKAAPATRPKPAGEKPAAALFSVAASPSVELVCVALTTDGAGGGGATAFTGPKRSYGSSTWSIE